VSTLNISLITKDEAATANIEQKVLTKTRLEVRHIEERFEAISDFRFELHRIRQ
jgi:hypothetical protein